MKTFLKLTAFSAVLLMLAPSCNRDERNGKEYKVYCAQILAGGEGFCPTRIIIESEEPIANTRPGSGFVHFFVCPNSLPQEFWGVNAKVTVVFRLTGKIEHCLGEWPVIEIITIEKCE